MSSIHSRSRLVAILLSCVLCGVGLSACSGKDPSKDGGEGASLEGDGGDDTDDEGDASDEGDGDGGGGGSGEGGTGLDGGTLDGSFAREGGAGNRRDASGPFSCMPTTCAAEGATCGRIDDGCGGHLSCGTCAAGKVCSPQSQQCTDATMLCGAAQCGALTDACNGLVSCGSCAAGQLCRAGKCETCVPRTCGAGECGVLPDGCGGTIDCKGCGTGEACDAIKHVCSACEPTSCLGEGVECGTISDGCGGSITCRACATGQSCVSGQCVPTPPPAECVAQGKNCGAITNACSGAAVNCGTCPSGESCINNECTSCVPTSCAEKGVSCGEISDGCGGKIACGDCTTGMQCYQGACCLPTSCAAQGKNCGTLNIGCGMTQDCGTCDTINNKVCGHGGVANVCATCTPTRTCANPDPNASGEAAWECGDLFDGCKNVRCGSCPSGEYCNNHACDPCPTMAQVCTAGVCGAVNTACGVIMCPGCPGGEGCGVGGVANRCGPCPMDLCVGKNCGTRQVPGCDPVTCGPSTCATGQSCGGGGVANVCGACTPRANACGARVCGTVSNGCTTESCGQACAAGERCINDGMECKKRKTCADYPTQCGPIDDGTGVSLDCACPDPMHQACVSGTCCQRQTCNDAARTFGGNATSGCVNGPVSNFPDGCGDIIQCPLCDTPIL
jgi:hypothetical protein